MFITMRALIYSQMARIRTGQARTQRYKFLPFKNGGTLAFSRAEKMRHIRLIYSDK